MLRIDDIRVVGAQRVSSVERQMAANQSIKELMAAETKASKIVSDARQGKCIFS